MLQCVPFPTCWRLRYWKHLFVILCIMRTSISLITSFPQDSSEMGLSYLHWKGSNVSNLVFLPQRFACFSQAATTLSCLLFCLLQLSPLLPKKNGYWKTPTWSPMIKNFLLNTWGLYRENLMVCFLSAINIKRFVLRPRSEFWTSFLSWMLGEMILHTLVEISYYHLPLSTWGCYSVPGLKNRSLYYLITQLSRCDCS